MAFARPMLPAYEEFQCPNCGARDSMGGCEDPRKCIRDLEKREDICISKIMDLVEDHPDSQPFHLMMAGFDAFDLLNLGLAVTDSSGRLLLANRTAERIFDMRDGLQLTSRGVLQASLYSSPDLAEALEQAANSSRSEASKTNDLALAVQRPSGRRPLTLLLRSVDGLSDDGCPPAAAALVFILDPELPVEADARELDELYGFTAAETRLANLLMQGKSLEDCCTELGIRRPTACSHLRRLFKKTHVQRQSQLVSLLLKSIGPMSRKSRVRKTPLTSMLPSSSRTELRREAQLFRSIHSSGRRQ
jgi:DNA-binding CsgD family transcriptional regulator